MNPTIEINRKSSLADDPVHLRIFGLEPAETYLLKTAMRDDFGRVWEALAEFTADGDGCIDLQSAVPQRGTYEGQDAMGLFWSMRLNDLSDKMPYFMKINTEPQTVTVIVDKNGDRLAERQFDQDAITEARKIKPSISLVGFDSISIRHEVEFVLNR
ncbi:MAG: acyl-CoA thioesterase/BAAT N-terminal domain-containing protein [Bacillota bacterium]